MKGFIFESKITSIDTITRRVELANGIEFSSNLSDIDYQVGKTIHLEIVQSEVGLLECEKVSLHLEDNTYDFFFGSKVQIDDFYLKMNSENPTTFLLKKLYDVEFKEVNGES